MPEPSPAAAAAAVRVWGLRRRRSYPCWPCRPPQTSFSLKLDAATQGGAVINDASYLCPLKLMAAGLSPLSLFGAVRCLNLSLLLGTPYQYMLPASFTKVEGCGLLGWGLSGALKDF